MMALATALPGTGRLCPASVLAAIFVFFLACPVLAAPFSNLALQSEQRGYSASRSPNLQLAQTQSFIAIPYLWAAEKTGTQPITLSGYAPDAAAQDALSGQAGVGARDMTQLADGAPDQFQARARAGLRALGVLSAGRVSFNGSQWSIVGRAESAAAKARAERMLRLTSPDGTWQIDITAEKVAALPKDDAEAEIETPLAPTGEEVAAGDETPPPANDVAPTADTQASIDSDNEITVTIPPLPEAVQIAAEPPLFEEPPADTVSTTMEPQVEQPMAPKEEAKVVIPVLPEAIKIALEPPVFASSAEDTEEAETTIGADNETNRPNSLGQTDEDAKVEAPSEDAVIGQTVEEDAVSDGEQLSEDAPLASNDEPQQPSASEKGDAATETPAETAQDQTKIAPVPTAEQPVRVPDRYLFAAVKQPGDEIQLSGVAPDEASKAYLGLLAGRVSTTNLSLGENAPEGFMIEAQKGLRALKQLETGVLRHEYGRWSLSGIARTAELEAALVESLGQGDSYNTALSHIPPTQICQDHIATFASENSILFAAGSARLTESSSEPLDRLTLYLNECPNTQVEIEGHTDADGAEDVNLALSVARAEAVVNALIARGIDFHRLYAIGYGESLPVASNDTIAGKRANRRIGFRILDKSQ